MLDKHVGTFFLAYLRGPFLCICLAQNAKPGCHDNHVTSYHKMIEIKPNKSPLNRDGMLNGTFGELEVAGEAVQNTVRKLISQPIKLVNTWIE